MPNQLINHSQIRNDDELVVLGANFAPLSAHI
jgi:hypothetical protein